MHGRLCLLAGGRALVQVDGKRAVVHELTYPDCPSETNQPRLG